MLHYFALTYLLYESTTIFMNPFVMMEMMKTHPKKKRGNIDMINRRINRYDFNSFVSTGPTFHKVQFYISVVFALLFLVIRMIGGNYYLYLLWDRVSSRLDELSEYQQIMWKIFFTMGVISSILNTYWFAEIVKQGKYEYS